MRLILWLAVALSLAPQQAAAPVAPAAGAPADSRIWIGHYAEYEEFLKTAEIDHLNNPKVGVTGGTRHAYFKPGGLAPEGAMRTLKPGRYDGYFESYKSEVAAYKLDRILELNQVPPTVERTYMGQGVSMQLWTTNVKMLKDIQEQKIAFPVSLEFSRQLGRQRVYDDLVANIDENATNLMFDAQWNIIKVDCSRCFTNVMTLPFEIGKQANRIDRPFFERIKALTRDQLRKEIGDFVEGGAIDAMLARRDDIVKKFEKLAKEKGEALVILP